MKTNGIKRKCHPWPIKKKIRLNKLPHVFGKIFGKIFEQGIFNSRYVYLEYNNILSKHQSGFRKSDSCTLQFLAIPNSRN